MPLVNAVRVVTSKRRRWVEDAASIATYGRLEAVLSVGELQHDTNDAVDAIGAAYLEAHASPLESVVADVDGAVGLDVGDTATVAGETLRVVGLTKSVEPDGTFRVVPEWSSLLQEAQFDRERVVERMIARYGGGFAAAATLFGGIEKLEGGRIGEIDGMRWSSQSLLDLEDEPWPVWKVEKPGRMYEFTINGLSYDDEEMEQIAFADTIIGLSVNGTLITPFFATLGEMEDEASFPLYGYAFLYQDDEVWPVVGQDGGHENVSITVRSCERV